MKPHLKICLLIIFSLIGLTEKVDASTRQVVFSNGTTSPVISLSSNGIEIEVVPELGGKVISLRGPDGHERLSRSSRPYVKRTSQLRYQDSEFDGLDEIFPTLVASPAGSNHPAIPEHGEVWYLPWKVLPGPGLNLEVKGECLPYILNRKISIHKQTVLFSYTLSNTGKIAFPYIYLFHPLFFAESGLDLKVPQETSFKIKGSKKLFLGTNGDTKTWKELKEGPLAGKLFQSDRGHYWNATLVSSTLNQLKLSWPSLKPLTLTWDKTSLPYCAFWSTEGAILGGLKHFALEPTSSLSDKLSVAAASGEAKILLPNHEAKWDILLTFDQ